MTTTAEIDHELEAARAVWAGAIWANDEVLEIQAAILLDELLDARLQVRTPVHR